MRPLHIIAVLFAAAVLALPLHAQDTSAQQAKKAELEKQIARIDKQLSENRTKSRNALSELNLVQKKRALRTSMIAQTEKQIRLYDDALYAKQRQINVLQGRVDTLTAYYARLVGGAYRNRDARIWYMYILASDNLSQAFRRYSYFKNLSSSMKDQAVKLREAKAEVEKEKAELEVLRKDALTVKDQRKKELTALQQDEKNCQGVVNELKRNRGKYEKELAAKKKQVEALNREIQRIIAEAVRKAGASKKTEVDVALASEFVRNKGRLPWPVDGTLTGKYGQHNHAVFTNVKLPFNYGVDVSTAKGARVCTVFEGVVKQIAVVAGNNQCVLVQHGDYFTLYCKLRQVKVKPGDKVTTGQQLGTVDTINGETQLHFEIWKGQTSQNPENWLK